MFLKARWARGPMYLCGTPPSVIVGPLQGMHMMSVIMRSEGQLARADSHRPLLSRSGALRRSHVSYRHGRPSGFQTHKDRDRHTDTHMHMRSNIKDNHNQTPWPTFAANPNWPLMRTTAGNEALREKIPWEYSGAMEGSTVNVASRHAAPFAWA